MPTQLNLGTVQHVALSAKQKIAKFLDKEASPKLLYHTSEVAAETGLNRGTVQGLAPESKHYSVMTARGYMWGTKSAIKKLKRLMNANNG